MRLTVEEVAQGVARHQHALFVGAAALVRVEAGLGHHAELPLLAARLPSAIRHGHGAPPAPRRVRHERRRGHADQTTQGRGARGGVWRADRRVHRGMAGRGRAVPTGGTARTLGAQTGQVAHVGQAMGAAVHHSAVVVPGVAVGLVRVRALVLVGSLGANPVATQQDEDVLAELLGQDNVQEGVGARVERIEEDEQDLGVADVDHGQAEGGGQPEEGYGRPAHKVGQHQDGHALGDGGVVATGHCVAGPYLRTHVPKVWWL